MDQPLSIPEVTQQLNALESKLHRLCRAYLDGCDSVYYIGFREISPPDPSDLTERIDDLETGLRQFLSGVIAGPMGGFVILEESKADVIRSIGAIPPTQADLKELFLKPMLETLQPLQPVFHVVSDEGELKYDELLKPVIMSVSYAALCIRDTWYILMAEWSD